MRSTRCVTTSPSTFTCPPCHRNLSDEQLDQLHCEFGTGKEMLIVDMQTYLDEGDIRRKRLTNEGELLETKGYVFKCERC